MQKNLGFGKKRSLEFRITDSAFKDNKLRYDVRHVTMKTICQHMYLYATVMYLSYTENIKVNQFLKLSHETLFTSLR